MVVVVAMTLSHRPSLIGPHSFPRQPLLFLFFFCFCFPWEPHLCPPRHCHQLQIFRLFSCKQGAVGAQGCSLPFHQRPLPCRLLLLLLLLRLRRLRRRRRRLTTAGVALAAAAVVVVVVKDVRKRCLPPPVPMTRKTLKRGRRRRRRGGTRGRPPAAPGYFRRLESRDLTQDHESPILHQLCQRWKQRRCW